MNTAIPVLVALIGLVLLGMMLAVYQRMVKDYHLKKHRAKDEAFADLLNYAAVVDDGVIVCKNGSFMASFFYKGADNASATDQERELVSFRINKAIGKLGAGWMMHVDAMRNPAPSYSDRNASHFPDRVSAAIDEERRRLFERMGQLYEGCFIVSFTWFPPRLAESKFTELMFDDERVAASDTTTTRNLLDKFKHEIAVIQANMSQAVSIERLGGLKVELEDGTVATMDQQLEYLQYCITGLQHPVRLPNNPIYLDSLIGGQEFYPGIVPRIGKNYVQVVAIEGYPTESYPGILSKLAEQPCEYRWSTRFIFLDSHEAISKLTAYRRKWKQKVRGFMSQLFNTNNGYIDEDALSMVQDASSAIAETNSGLVSQGYMTSVIVLMNEDRKKAEDAAEFMRKAINNLGFTARIETINTVDAYFGSLPGHGVENVRRPLVNTLNLADLMPTSTIWPGENKAPSPMFDVGAPPLMHGVTSGNTPFRFNLHVRDLGHGFMFGPTRAGKSTHLALTAMQWRRYEGSRIYAFDKGLSMYPTCKAVGGSHFTIAADDDRLAFAPLSRLDTPSRRSWAMEWIESILILNNVHVDSTMRNAIADAIKSMAASGSKTLSEFSVTVQNVAIRDALKQYTIDGNMGHLLDAEEDGLDMSDFMTFEIENLMNMDQKYAMPVLLYLFRRIEESLDGRPTLIILDEAWLMLGHEAFRGKIREWLKSMAKKNCSVLMATQQLGDAAKSGILDVIIESTASRIFLPNPNALQEEALPLYLNMGLNRRQVEIIASAIPKRDYYYVSEEGRRLYQLALGPLALAFVGATDPDSIKTIRELSNTYGDKWVDEWLRTKGLELNDYEVAA
ncbi:VirB4 family type IV secretion/conjugal transfer ATPase [Salmonella enterica]|uniref:VirB4 family type IV secretion/conjugal transfer ATPase n=1 Tax=Klebsiella pneumoniae TaxID=573 RepID=UPI0017D54AD6|nr:VirB4 family type IV secretion/conjugal transfer ATPase [Salmonella enterica]